MRIILRAYGAGLTTDLKPRRSAGATFLRASGANSFTRLTRQPDGCGNLSRQNVDAVRSANPENQSVYRWQNDCTGSSL
jgi:hypothetical protein